jgi:hypothetical protein
MDDQLLQLERRVAQLESELLRTQHNLGRAKRRSGITWGVRALAAASVALALTGITAAAASSNSTPKPLRAPFTVVDSAGKTIMTVTDSGTLLRGPIKVRDQSDYPIMYLGSDGHLTVGHGNTAAVTLGVTPEGGKITVFNKSGNYAEDMGLDSGKPYFQIAGKSGSPAVKMEAYSQGGYFVLTDPTGHAAVEEGVTTDDIGVVRAYGPGGLNYLAGRK